MAAWFTRLFFASALLAGSIGPAWAADHPAFTHTEDVIYGRKYGTALTLDVFTPKAKANGAAVVFIISRGWCSGHDGINAVNFHELLAHGYTVFAVVHGSFPKFTIPEAIADVHRAVRFVRAYARDFQIDPERIGITGSSAGGHLSLMLGTTGKEGDPRVKDPVERVSSRVQAVACCCPPSDFLNYGAKGKEMLRALQELDPKTGLVTVITDGKKCREFTREISPLYHVSAESAPTLIIHGDADTTVPLQQGEIMVAKLKEAGVPTELVVKQGAGHTWPGMDKDMKTLADWFDKYLAKRQPGSGADASTGPVAPR